MFNSNIHNFDTMLIGDKVKIFDSNRFDEFKEHWGKRARKTRRIPKPDKVFKDMKNLLKFLSKK
jgi:hypothetical protein